MPGPTSNRYLTMKKLKSKNRFLRRARLLYLKAVHINDSPGKIALGVAIGVFCGIMPAMGLVVALLLAFVFKANRAAAILGSAATNAWISFVSFLLSIKLGSVILGIDWREVYRQWHSFAGNFRFRGLFEPAILKILAPLATGYLVIAALAGLGSYVVTFILVRLIRAHKNRAKFSG